MTPISLEFFPPKTDKQHAQFERAVPRLMTLDPEFVSVTFGAGGSTLTHTPRTVRHLRETHELAVAPHVSCMGGSREEIAALLAHYRELGCKRIVALRGDLPSGMAAPGDFRYASDLVDFIRREHGGYFHIEVGCYPECHPQSEHAQSELEHFKIKVDAGADGAITQYFFNADAYFRFVDEAQDAGITIPIVPGIMPISNFVQLKRFSDMCGAEIPRWISKRIAAFPDDAEAVREFGADVVAAMCRRLLEGGAPGLHLYTLNRARASQAVVQRLDGSASNGSRLRSAAP